MKPPVAGPNIPAIEGMMEEYRLIVRALAFAPLSLNCSKLKLGQNVARLTP